MSLRTASSFILWWNSVKAATCSTTCSVTKDLVYLKAQSQASCDSCLLPYAICMAWWWHILTLLHETFCYLRALLTLPWSTSQQNWPKPTLHFGVRLDGHPDITDEIAKTAQFHCLTWYPATACTTPFWHTLATVIPNSSMVITACDSSCSTEKMYCAWL